MSSFLADTQIVLWAAGSVERLSPSVLAVLEDPDHHVRVSAVSIAEMAIKQSIGKLSLPVAPLDLCSELGFDVLDLTGEHSQAVSTLPLLHRDPFDRLLIAQAMTDASTLITADDRIASYPGVTVLHNRRDATDR
jgi:PIN domain nuclease of toxin-antitoxin system